MALTHEFTKTKQENIQAILSDVTLLRDTNVVSPVVEIHDDFILYFADSMKWVATTNPRKAPKAHLPHQSLCYYGITLFLPHQVPHFKQIIKAWYDMFVLAPDEFSLRGLYTFSGDNPEKGEYNKILVVKADILKQLSDLIGLCEDVENDDSLCLFHWGI